MTAGPCVSLARIYLIIRSGRCHAPRRSEAEPHWGFDTWAEFCRGLPWRLPAPTHADRGLTSHFGVARPITEVIGLRRSGWRRSVDHDRKSLREHAQKQVDHSRRTQSPTSAVRGEASL